MKQRKYMETNMDTKEVQAHENIKSLEAPFQV